MKDARASRCTRARAPAPHGHTELRHSCQPGQRLDQVVVYDHHREEYQEDKCRLVDALFYRQANLLLHQALDEEQQDHAAIQDGDGQQVHDAEGQADGRADQRQGRPTLVAGGGADGAANPNRTIDLAHGNLALHHLLQQFENQEGTSLVVGQRALQRVREVQMHNLGGKIRDADPVRRSLPGTSRVKRWFHSEGHLLAVAQHFQVQRLILGAVQHLDQRAQMGDILPIRGQDLVSDLEPGLTRRHIRFDQSQTPAGLLCYPTDIAVLVRPDGLWNQSRLNDFAVPLDTEVERLVGAQRVLDMHLLPIGILDLLNLDDLIAALDASFFGGSVGIDPAYNGRLVQIGGILVVHHINAGEQHNGEHDIHRRTGQGYDEALPAGVREKLSRIAGAVIHRVFARHLYVTAERDGADAVVGVAAGEAQQTLAKADGKDFHAHAKIFGGGIMSELMNQNHESEHNAHVKNGMEKRQKLGHID